MDFETLKTSSSNFDWLDNVEHMTIKKSDCSKISSVFYIEICLAISGLTSIIQAWEFILSKIDIEETSLLWIGFNLTLLQHSRLQPICGKPPSWTVPNVKIEWLFIS